MAQRERAPHLNGDCAMLLVEHPQQPRVADTRQARNDWIETQIEENSTGSTPTIKRNSPKWEILQ
jgi:hypothetical protein